MLTTKIRGTVDNFPREFLANIGLDILSQEVPLDIEPEEVTGLLIESKTVQERTNERKKTDTFLTQFPDTELDSETFVDSTGQTGTRKRMLVPDGTPLEVDENTESADQRNLGNGWLDQVIVELPDLYHHNVYERKRRILTPDDFLGLLPIGTYAHTEYGQAADPTLTPGQISTSDEDDTIWHHRLSTDSIDILSLPMENVNKRTTEVKQFETITRILELDTVTPATPTATRNVTFTKLGDGTALEIHEDVDSVFGREQFTRTRPIVTPEDFRALIQESGHALTAEGAAADPVLSPGEISAEDEQVDVFDHRLTTREIPIIGLPQTIINERTNDVKQVEQIFRTLELETATPASPSSVQNVTFTKLGDGTALEERFVVDEIFPREIFGRDRGIVTPQDFRALLQESSHAVTEEGLASDPVLAVGETSRTDEQVDVFDHRTTSRFLPLVSIPQTLINERTNDVKQTETIYRTLELDTTPPADPSSTQNVTFTRLGDGTAVEERSVVDEIFPREVFTRERPIVTPQDFRALLQESSHAITEEGVAADPTLAPGQSAVTDEQVDVFDHRLTERFLPLVSIPQTLVNEKTNEFKQTETIYRTLELDTTTPSNPTATQDVTFTKLGDGTAIEERSVVDDVFGREKFSRERGVVTPSDFRALLQEREHSVVSPGIASDPSLVAGEIAHSEQQVDVFDMLETSRSIDTLSLPSTIVNKRTNEFKQVETVTRILELDTVVPATPTSLRNVQFTKLGDGTALEEHFDVPSLFDHLASSTEIADLIPEIFKATIPSHTHEQVVAGTVVDPPVLASGDFEKVEQQVDVFSKRVRTRGRGTVAVPQTTVAQRKFSGAPFGGEVTRVTAFLDDSEPAVEVDYENVGSEVTNLGNGRWVRQTERLDVAAAWPILHGQEYDEGLDVLVPFVEQVIEQNTGIGTLKTDIKPIDKTKARKRTIDSTAAEAVLGSYLMEYPSKTAVNMPDKLISLTSQMTNQTGDAADSETGTSTGYGNYSINLDLRADATASATVIPEVFAEIKQFYAPNVDCTHYVFFLPNPVVRADVIAKINSLIAPATVEDWPKFNPQTITILIVGANSALKVNAVSKGSYSQSADLTSQSSTAGGGTGYSRAKGLTIRRMQISPTIHDTIIMGGTTSHTVNLEAACDSEAAGLGPAEAIDVTDSVSADVSPTSFPATDGATDWPTVGKFLYRVDARPYKYGYVMFHAIVVDAADFPTNP